MIAADFCPYRGLTPFGEEDAGYFFGRDREVRLLEANLQARRLSVVYGEGGVGKSSVLRAGVIPRLRRDPGCVTVWFSAWQEREFAALLARTILSSCAEALEVSAEQLEREIGDSNRPLNELLAACAARTSRTVLLVFDQFEEVFRSNTSGPAAERFDAELARAINRRDLDVNVLISLRADNLDGLDRYQTRIRDVLDNLIRIDHLDRDAARQAIIGPIEQYNRNAHPGSEVTLEPDLVEEVIEQTALPRNAAPDGDERSGAVRVATHILQLVMTQLWNENALGSNQLGRESLTQLGGASHIVDNTVHGALNGFSQEDQRAAAAVLRMLVTPSGLKLAQSAGDLATYSQLPPDQVSRVLDLLVTARIARRLEGERYEISLDVIAQSVQGWLRDFETKEQVTARVQAAESNLERRMIEERLASTQRTLRILVSALAVVACLAVVLVWFNRQLQTKTRQLEIANQKLSDRNLRDITGASGAGASPKPAP